MDQKIEVVNWPHDCTRAEHIAACRGKRRVTAIWVVSCERSQIEGLHGCLWTLKAIETRKKTFHFKTTWVSKR